LTKSKIVIDFGESDDGEAGDALLLDIRANATSTAVRNGTTQTKKIGRRAAGTGKTKTRSGTTTRSVRKGTSTRSRTRVSQKSAPKKSNSFVFGAIASIFVFGFLYTQQDIVKNFLGGSFGGSRDTSSINAQNKGQVRADKSETGSLTFSNYDFDMEVYVNGVKRELDGIAMKVPFNKNLKVSIKKSGYKKYEHEVIRLSKSDQQANINIPTLERERIGLLSTSRNFTSGSKIIFYIDGDKIERNLPIDNYRVPAGAYKGVIANPLLGTERSVKFVIEENKKLFLE
jgi:hypothetical protein